jgi:two-component system sensor histidine kinase KdpD
VLADAGPVRGRLLVYAGMCDGAGTTTRMLAEGHRLAQDGVDVLVGAVATCGRARVAALADGLEAI